MLAILIQRCCANTTQFAAGQLRLEHVGCVRRALGIACANNRVQLIDKENDLPLGRRDLLQKGLQAILEFAAVFRACNHRA